MDNNKKGFKMMYQDCPEVVRSFLSYMQNIKVKSANTVQEYYLDLRTFFRFMLVYKKIVPFTEELETVNFSIVDITFIKSINLADTYEYLNYINTFRGNSAKTRSRKISCLRTFFKYLVKMSLIEKNPMVELEVPAQKKSLPIYLNLEEAVDFLEAIDGDYKARDFCIMTIFLNTGIRLSELTGINIQDIKDDVLTVTGKGNKQRIVYLNDTCKLAIENYLKVRPNKGLKDQNALFVSRLGNRLSNKTVQWRMKEILLKSGLAGKGYSVHKLRHTAATLMYQHGKTDIRVLKDLLGHENLSTTEIYTHVSNEQIKEAVQSSPLSKIKIKNKES